MQDKIEAAQKSLSSAPPAIETVKEALKEGEKLLKYCQKLIRIAGGSEYGWATVSEYEEDELADGSDDEKRLYRAELRAGKKGKVGKAAKRKSSSHGGKVGLGSQDGSHRVVMFQLMLCPSHPLVPLSFPVWGDHRVCWVPVLNVVN